MKFYILHCLIIICDASSLLRLCQFTHPQIDIQQQDKLSMRGMERKSLFITTLLKSTHSYLQQCSKVLRIFMFFILTIDFIKATLQSEKSMELFI